MKTFQERLREDRRLVLLRLLAEQNGYRANSSILYMGLQHLGIAASRDDVLTDLYWLRDQSLLTIQEVGEKLCVCTLNSRGEDVVLGVAIVPGVSRPSAR